MTGRDAAPSSPPPYSPERRTALVFTGIGTAGAYHAGALRALQEAGVKLDVVAGRGVGVIGALFSAVDRAQRLWDEKGFWTAPAVRHFYPWRPMLSLAAAAVTVAVAVVVVPIAAIALGLVVFPLDFVAKMLGLSAAGGLVSRYLALADAAFRPTALPTWLPRLVVLVLSLAAAIGAVAAWVEGSGRRSRGPIWWRVVRPPLLADTAIHHCWSVLWDSMRGAARLKEPSPAELGRRFTELLGENLGQPGFREFVVTVHDLDARRDLVVALVGESRRQRLVKRSTIRDAEIRRAELLDLSGVGRDHLADAVAASLTVPLGTDPHVIQFAAESYWRGERHRLCDRPASLVRLVEELVDLDVQQIILIAAAPESPGPHSLAPERLDGRGRLGEYLQSAEATVVRDLISLESRLDVRIFTIQPEHNPIGPFDFGGGYDDRSDRTQPLTELISRGYEDAYHQFIEPMLGASGDQIA